MQAAKCGAVLDQQARLPPIPVRITNEESPPPQKNTYTHTILLYIDTLTL
jgi:hypothetical protein